MSTKAIIFDKDGTLIDFDSFWVEVSRYAIKTILNKTGMKTVSTDEILEALGVENGVTRIDGVLCWGTYGQLGDAIAKALSLHGYTPNGDDLAAITREAYNLAGDKGKVTATCNDIIGTLTELKNRGIILAVVTADGPEMTKKCLDDLKITELFDKIYTDDGIHPPKPDPYCINNICEEFNIKKDDVIMVGDTLTDVNFAKNGGIRMIAVAKSQSNKELLLAHTDIVLNNVSELINIIE